MSEMVERMAIRLDEVMYKPERGTEWSQAPAQHHNVCRKLARHVLEGMLDPTEAMMEAALSFSDPGGDVPMTSMEETYRAMIGAELK